MKIIFSPTKTMNDLTKFSDNDIPEFIDKAFMIKEELKKLDKESLNKILKVNDKLLDINYKRYQTEDLKLTSKAILTYSGLSYKNLDYDSLDDSSQEYLNEHLRIVSGLYGILRPLDGIINYRLEMNYADIYWTNLKNYFKDENFVLDLASKEYSKIFNDDNIIKVVFYEQKNNKLVEQSTNVKIMRGLFLRYLALNKITDYDELKKIEINDYKYDDSLSKSNKLVYVKAEII